MKKNREKGFTLIELLAVIIILGVLMLIAIPSVTRYIADSRKNVYISTAKKHIEGAITKVNGLEYPFTDTDITYYVPASCIPLEKGGNSPFGKWKAAYAVVTFNGNNYNYYWTSVDEAGYGILLTYEKLLERDSIKTGINGISTDVGVGSRSTITLLDSSCKMENATSKSAESTISERGTLANGSTPTEVLQSYTDGSIVYFNPETGLKCDDYAVGNSNTNNKSGCMKWYVFNSDNASSTANLILDHNTTANVAWNLSGDNTIGPVIVNARLVSDVSGWESSVKATARLITANEVAQVTGHPTFDSTQAGPIYFFYFDTNTGTSISSGWKYGWLYDRTRNNCTGYGCLNNEVGTDTYGYWTSSPYVDINPNAAWGVYFNGTLGGYIHDASTLYKNFVGDTTRYGVRPVITVLKSKL